MHILMKDIVMDFGPVRAVDHVTIDIKSGNILGLLGENGAGKSTLMNILGGVFPPTQGSLFFDENPVKISNALHASKLGIRFIHQELNLCNDLTVYENMFLAHEITNKSKFFLQKNEMIQKAKTVFNKMQVQIDPCQKAGDLQTSEKQLVEIARALLDECCTIIMDEPTTALAGHEIDSLFAIMRQLKQEGVGFVYISHRMPEIFEICDSFYVLRDGKRVGHGEIANTTKEEITQMMIGKQLADEALDQKESTATKTLALEVNSLSGDGFEDISFSLNQGEIIVITGLQSSGRDMLADALFGVVPTRNGNILLNEQNITKNRIVRRMKKGLALVPRNRKERGILKDLSIIDNLSMGFYNTKLAFYRFIRKKNELQRFYNEKEKLNIKTDHPENPITSLSGGNQQKVILARWLETDANVLLFDNPTQGIDVGSKFEIYQIILELAKNGKAIIVFSSEFPEIYKLADRCIVLYKGKINAVMQRSQLNEAAVMHYATGANLED